MGSEGEKFARVEDSKGWENACGWYVLVCGEGDALCQINTQFGPDRGVMQKNAEAINAAAEKWALAKVEKAVAEAGKSIIEHWRKRLESAARHSSDCAIYNAPALPVGPCDCHLRYAVREAQDAVWEEAAKIVEGYSCMTEPCSGKAPHYPDCPVTIAAALRAMASREKGEGK